MVFGIGEFGRRLGDVLRYVDQHRAGPPGRREVERLLDRHGELGDVLHQEVVLHARPRDADGIALLERVLADRVRGHLPGEDHHRHRVHVRGGDPGHGVGYTGTGGDQAYPDLLARPRVAVGRVRCSLLVPHQDVLDLVLLEQRVVDVEHRAARVAEDVLDPLLLEAADDDFCAR